MSVTLDVKETNISDLWEIQPSREGKYTENDVIDAFLKGKKTGLESYQRTLVKALNENVDKCGSYTEQILHHLKELGIESKDSFLRINKFDLFNVLICVSERDFLKEEFFSVYDFVTDFEDEKNTSDNTFAIQFSFLDFQTDYCINTINSDGYILKFKK
ncbi:hypothetical protein [Sphingobacterium paludis]|uniref:Uncharacterized protein n=1 Tax=Sphingobacterium paludis TaxID=1476465 RepID=A0A4R7CYZ6_9SPHI|nr:hypothetical protein [Sphingobacterium paludis]TDS11746.1 hypothetical protein B0I21_10789 [Sphingobacterium paludis]